METVGRKGSDFFRKRHGAISGERVGMTEKANYAYAADIAKNIIARFAAGEIDAVYLLYNEFKSVMTQRLVVSRILPVELPPEAEAIEFIFEQPPAQLLDKLLPRYVEIEIYQALLESGAAQQAARMTAMDAATSNAAEMIDNLTLYMNRVRQASITREIIEVVSGAAGVE
jgi:F-type H+-transporting ATPase subunit gamma